MKYFCVFSPKIEDFDEVYDVVYRHVMDYPKYLLVKEMGRDETHPHLNFVFEAPSKIEKGRKKFMEHSNITRRIKNIFDTDILKDNPRLICIKKCHDTHRLVNKYLTKEKNYEVILSKGFKIKTPENKVIAKEIKELNQQIRELALWIRDNYSAPPGFDPRD